MIIDLKNWFAVIIFSLWPVQENIHAQHENQVLAMDEKTTPTYASERPPPPTDPVLTDIARYVYHHEIRSPLAMERARIALLDALGCAIETLSSNQCPSFIGPIVKGCSTRDGFRLPGTIFELDPVKGAFDMAVLIRYLDHNDAFTGAEWGHPSGMDSSELFPQAAVTLRQTILAPFWQLPTGSVAIHPKRPALRLL